MTKTKLTNKQQLFIKEYLVDFVGGRAAIRAGYSPKHATSTASRLLANIDIQEALADEMQARCDRVEIDADWVLIELAKLYKTGLSSFMSAPVDDDGNVIEGAQPVIDLSKATAEQIDTLEEVIVDTIGEVSTRTKIKKASPLQILDKIGKHVNVQAWKEKAEIENSFKGLPTEELIERRNAIATKILEESNESNR